MTEFRGWENLIFQLLSYIYIYHILLLLYLTFCRVFKNFFLLPFISMNIRLFFPSFPLSFLYSISLSQFDSSPIHSFWFSLYLLSILYHIEYESLPVSCKNFCSSVRYSVDSPHGVSV